MSQKISLKGLKFHAPLTDKFLQTSVLASDVSAYHNHCSAVNGSPTYSSAGVELDGSTDDLNFPATGVFNSTEITIAFRFTPDNDYDYNKTEFFLSSTDGSRYMVYKHKDSGNHILGIFLGDTAIVYISSATYGPYWNVGVENTLIITGDEPNHVTNAWLNGNQILVNDATWWTNDDPAVLYIGCHFGDASWFDGEIRDLMIFDRLWTAEERAAFDACSEGLHAPQKIGSLQKGLVFHAPLTDKYLQTSVLASDVSAKHNHCDTANGAPTYSSARGVELDGTNDDLEFPATGVFNSTEITIAIRFTPDFDWDEDKFHTLFDCTNGSRYTVVKYDNAGSNILSIKLGDTTVAVISSAIYGPFWNVNEENTLIVTGDDTNNLTNVWLNGVQMVTDRPTPWANADPSVLYIGAFFNNTSPFDGEIRDFMVWNRILTAGERAILDARAYVNPLYEGLVFCAPLTDDYLEGGGLPSDISPGQHHVSSVVGAPTYSSAGMELDGTTDGATVGAGLLNSTTRTIALRFTPDFDTDEDVERYFFFSSQFTDIRKRANVNSNVLRFQYRGILVAGIPEATYSPYWNVGVENTLICEFVSGATNIWMNGTLIRENDSTAFEADTGPLNIGYRPGTGFWDGEIRDFAIWDRVLTANERAQYENSTEGAII